MPDAPRMKAEAVRELAEKCNELLLDPSVLPLLPAIEKAIGDAVAELVRSSFDFLLVSAPHREEWTNEAAYQDALARCKALNTELARWWPTPPAQGKGK